MARGTILFVFELVVFFPLIAYMLERRKTEIPNWKSLTVLISGLLALSEGSRSIVLGFLTQFDTVRYDQYIFVIDRYFGNPSFATRQFLNEHQWLWLPVAGAYNHLANIVILILFWHLWRRPVEDILIYVKSMVITPTLAVLAFIAIPVSGPIYAFKDFPTPPGADFVPHAMQIAARPNCIPSVHMTSAFFLLWFLRKSWAGRIFSVVFIALTVLSTLGGGEHYLFDLLLAVPYAILMLYVSGASLTQLERPARATAPALLSMD
jgi:PAP2 superfamily